MVSLTSQADLFPNHYISMAQQAWLQDLGGTRQQIQKVFSLSSLQATTEPGFDAPYVLSPKYSPESTFQQPSDQWIVIFFKGSPALGRVSNVQATRWVPQGLFELWSIFAGGDEGIFAQESFPLKAKRYQLGSKLLSQLPVQVDLKSIFLQVSDKTLQGWEHWSAFAISDSAAPLCKMTQIVFIFLAYLRIVFVFSSARTSCTTFG